MGMAWRIARVVLPVVASVAALVAVGYAIDWAEVAGIALATPLWAVAACVAVTVAELMLAGLRLSLLANAIGAPLSRPAAMSIWGVSYLAGLVLPTAVGNEVVKGGFLLKVSPNPVRVIGVVATERVVALFAMILLVLVSAPLAAWHVGHPLAMAATIACGAALGLIVLAWIFRAAFVALARRGASMVRVPEKAVDDFAATLMRVPFASALGLSLVIHGGTVVLIGILLSAAGAADPVMAALLGAPAVILISALPISVGGFGVREAAFVVVFGLFGTEAAIAASVGLAWWGVQVIAALLASALAGLWFVAQASRRPVAPA